ncbi:MAG TPA: enoyl-CoA hydratase-related protein [Longimicrobiales bacterium]|nr:enoyl-CoA hydratase-related protein [Longimicrobiales bacterium]
MSEPVLLERIADGVAALTLNRPEKRNALSAELRLALHEALDRTALDDSVRVVTLAGAGKDFCAGADLAELERIAEAGREESLRDARSLGGLFRKMRTHPRPIVALVHGRALAGGCGLATACDLVLARDDAELGYPEIHLGFVPALVMTMLRRKLGEGRAFEMVALGRKYAADEARALGLVNAAFSAEGFDAQAGRWVRDLASRPPGALRLTKKLLYELDALGFDAGLERAAEVNAEARTSEECREGVRRFLER